MANLFKKKEIFKVKSIPIDPSNMTEPMTSEDYQKRGMAFYARKQYDAAEGDLKKGVSLNSTNLDAHYSLGMVQKALGKKDEAISSFTRVLELISSYPAPSNSKYDMLRRLALGHINEISQGDWNLEKEIWKHIA
jgi:tetratricopeptide (TPR) repeat protein